MMKNALLLLTLAVSLAGYSRTTATIDWTSYAPTPAPKGLMITFAEGPDTRGFAWQTDTSVSESRVWLLKGTYGSADAAAFDASTTVFGGTATTVDKPTLVCHQVKVTGLEPGTTYSYRYGGNGHYAYGTFAVPASDQPITVLHVSDIQIKDFAKLYTWENTAERAAATVGGADKLDFIISSGDLYDQNSNLMKDDAGNVVRDSKRYLGWAIDVDTAAPYFPGVAWVPVAGNHDCAVYPLATAVDYQLEYTYADSTLKGCQSLDYGSVHVATIPYAGGWSAQYDRIMDWLHADLQAAKASGKAKWTVVVTHWGPYAIGDHLASSAQLVERLTPICASNHVDLVLQGHEHTYMKSLPYRWDAAGYTTQANDATVVNLSPQKVTVGDAEYDLDPNGTYYLGCGAAGHRVGENVEYVAESGANSYRNFKYRVETGKLALDSAWGTKGANAAQDLAASMFGVLRVDGATLTYDWYVVPTNGTDEAVHYDALKIRKTSAEGSRFRVTPYVQHPSTNAMSLIWFTDREGTATLRWGKADGSGAMSEVQTAGVWAEALTNNLTTSDSGVSARENRTETRLFKHRCRLTGLETGTRYAYEVELDGGEKYANAFKTAPGPNSPIRFVYYSDCETETNVDGAGNRSRKRTGDWTDPVTDKTRNYLVTKTEGYASNLVTMVRGDVSRSRELDMFVIAGDLAQSGGVQADWDEFWKHNAGGNGLGYDDPAGSIPILAAIGNHDYSDSAGTVPGAGNLRCDMFGGETGVARYLSYFEYEPNGVDFSDGVDHMVMPESGEVVEESLDDDAETFRDRSNLFHRQDYGPVTLLFLDTNNGDDSAYERDTSTAKFRDSHSPSNTCHAPSCRAPNFNPGSKQYVWLTNNLAQAQRESKFTFVVCHQCPYSAGYHCRKNWIEWYPGQAFPDGKGGGGEWLSGRALRVFDDVFNRYGVDGFLCGHDEMMEHSRVPGKEVLPDGTEREHFLNVFDMGIGGDGMRGGDLNAETRDNPDADGHGRGPYEVFRAHWDAPEVYENGVLVAGGKHYGHMEVNVKEEEPGLWTCTLEPVYVFVSTNAQGQAQQFERRVYADVTVITNDLRQVKPPEIEPTVLLDFADGTPGEDVTTVSNLGTLGADGNGTASHATGGAVRYSADTPGKNLYADQTTSERLTTEMKSIEFTAADITHGGVVKIPGLGKTLCEYAVDNGAFTLEFFVKVAADAAPWCDFVKFYYQSETSANQQAKYVVWGSNVDQFGLQMNTSNPTSKTGIKKDVWYHLAAVYTKGEGDAPGQWKMYCNGDLYATQTGTIVGPGTTVDLCLGGASTTYECFSGKLAGLRVTDAALDPGQFLRADSLDYEKQAELDGALGFWTFTDGESGTDVSGAANVVDPADRLIGAALGTGRKPTYFDEAPGANVFSASVDGKIIAKNAKSAKFYGNSDNTAGSRLMIQDIERRMAKAGAGTLEFFCKFDESYSWRDVFAMTKESGSFKLCNRTDAEQFVVQYYVGSGNAPEHYVNTTSTLVGNWHHVAFAWDAVSKDLTLYIDYVPFWTEPNVEFTNTAHSGYFGCGRTGGGELFNGKISCVRLMPRRLAPTEMMVATNIDDPSAYDDATVFHWSFEEPTAANGADVAAAAGAPTDLPPYRGGTSHQNSRLPTYSSDVYLPEKAYTAQGKGTDRSLLSTNQFCAYFYGYSEKYNNTWAGSHIEQLTVLDGFEVRPESFTVEMFLRRDLAARADGKFGTNGQLIGGFGASGIDTQSVLTDWTMYLRSDVSAHTPYFSYYDGTDTPQGKNIDVENISFEDGAWHHFAVTYDAGTKRLAFYLDYELKREVTLSNGLRRTTDKKWRHAFGRGFNVSGFNGWMDDIRLSRKARPVSEFLRKANARKTPLYLFVR